MGRMFFAKTTVLVKLKFTGCRPLILGGRIVTLFAFGTDQINNNSHEKLLTRNAGSLMAHCADDRFNGHQSVTGPTTYPVN